jgi:hypothetical protein
LLLVDIVDKTTQLNNYTTDIQKLPEALPIIKEEIANSCPKLITKGKPFRAKITSFERDHVQVSVDCRFDMRPVGDAFWQEREEMYLAIDRGVRRSGLDHHSKPAGCYWLEEK